MKTRRLRIHAKLRERPIESVRPEHFRWSESDEVDPHLVLQDPAFTVYSFDPEHDSVLFVETPSDVNLADAPFYYTAQYEHAIGLASMPFSVFLKLADEIKMPNLILVHSVGRCGSTLLSKAMAGIPDVESLSEPDELTQLMGLRSEKPEAWMRDAIFSSVRWRCKARRGTPAHHVAIKMRAEVMNIADLLTSFIPEARHLFMYRDGVSWAQSIYALADPSRDFADVELNRKMQKSWASMMPTVAQNQREDPPLNPIEIRILSWANCMETYLAMRDTGAAICAFRYEELTANPPAVLDGVFEFCGIKYDSLVPVLAAFERDSQAGTHYAQQAGRKEARALPDWLRQSAVAMIATRPLLLTPDVILPGTIRA